MLSSAFFMDANTQVETLLSPQELHQQLPLRPAQKSFIQRARHVIRDILDGKNSKLLCVVGPCSIHDVAGAKEYAQRLRDLSEEVSERFFLVMRTYFEKPRTRVGWKGLLYDPHLDNSHDIKRGLRLMREFLLELADMEVPCGTEFLDPVAPHYFADLISWGCVGARTAASQIHRQMASSLPMPLGFKNATDGDCSVAIAGVLSASLPHAFISINSQGRIAQVRSTGNSHSHVVLRGGDQGPNFDSSSITQVARQLRALDLRERLLVDCAHDNSGKDHRRQPIALQSLIEQVVNGSQTVAGFLLESYLGAGNQSDLPAQSTCEARYGISMTDPCLDWDSTRKLLLWAHERLLAASAQHVPADVYAQ